MSQHDYVIENAPGAAVRSDLNSAFQAIATLNSGATAPATIFPNMFWMDESTNILKVRTAANDAWINVAEKTTTGWFPYFDTTKLAVVGQAEAEAGTATTARIWTAQRVKQAIVALAAFTPTAANALAGSVVQVVSTQTGAVATGTTVIPYDDTIPQSGEGNEYMTRAITPKSATNILKIDVVIFLRNSKTSGQSMIAALFKDSDSDALASGFYRRSDSSDGFAICFTHYVVAGGTSEITFKVRAGGGDAGTTTFNGGAGARLLGGVMASSITIQEIKA